jgi:hypothetical protein
MTFTSSVAERSRCERQGMNVGEQNENHHANADGQPRLIAVLVVREPELSRLAKD